MIELVLVFCLGADVPDDLAGCIERRDPTVQFADTATCMMDAQRRAQPFMAAHPKLHLARWRCEVDLPRQEKA